MRRLIATMLAICLGILLPSAAMPVRVCLLGSEERSDHCCNSCNDTRQDCCADLDLLPDSPLPGGLFETPAFVGYAIPSISTEPHGIITHIPPPPCFTRLPTGIGPPTARLAVLNVWRL
jgi:hypothetical protein